MGSRSHDIECDCLHYLKGQADTMVKLFSSTSQDSMFTTEGMVARDQKIELFVGVSYENSRQEAAAGNG
jgi:hypothetical protein